MNWPKRALKITAATLVAIPILLLIALNIGPGRVAVETLVPRLTSNQVRIQNLHGRFPDALRLGHLELHDPTGPWLTADDIALDWSPLTLLTRRASIQRLTIATLTYLRSPKTAPTPAPTTPPKPFTLPLRITLDELHIAHARAAGADLAADLAIDGTADVATPDQAQAKITITRQDSPGTYTLDAHLQPTTVQAKLDLAEPPGGLIASLAQLPGLGALHLTGTLDGPRDAVATNLALTAGPLGAATKGTIDLTHQTAQLDVTANAPAMSPRPDIAWQSITLAAHIAGPWTAPDAQGRAQVDSLTAAGTTLARLTADLRGNAGQATLHATADGLRPAGAATLFDGAPLIVDATAQLDSPTRPVNFALSHPRLAAKGTAQTAPEPSLAAAITLPDLLPFAAIAGLDVRGRTAFTLAATPHAATIDGTLDITGGLTPLPTLIGPATYGVTATFDGPDLALTRATLKGRALDLAATGSRRADQLDASARLTLPNLAALSPAAIGALTIDTTVKGPADTLAVTLHATGEAGTPTIPRGPITLDAAFQGLPARPTGTVTARGTLAGTPLDLALTARRDPDGTAHATIDRADWKSLHAEGALTLPPAATVPLGTLALRMTRLDDFAPLLKQPLTGALVADLVSDPGAVRLSLDARQAGIPGSRVGHAQLTARVADPTTAPTIAAQLTADGIDAAGTTGSAKLDLAGPMHALAFRTTAALRIAGTDTAIAAAATADLPQKRVTVATLQATARGETLKLLAPATLRYDNTVAVDRLRLGLRQATLDIAGRLSPTLDATVALRTPADIAAAFAPDLAADGQISLDARLTGTPAQPGGTVKLAATGLRARTGPGRAAPPATIAATAQLAGGAAQIDTRLTAGTAALTVAGRLPLGPGALSLQARGGLDLALLDPILAASGRQARGRLSIDAGVGGTLARPALTGTATLAHAEFQDFTQGLRLSQIAGTIRAEGQGARLALDGRAGPGTIAITGTIGALDPALPIDLAIALRNARPLASDRLTADLDGDLTLRGPAAALNAAGKLTIRSAEIRVPERLPASVAVLDVRRPGQKPPPPATPSRVDLDLTIDAPRAIFVRGRGLDTEMAGTLRIRGSAAAPEVTGGFDMRRGTLSVAGTTLAFTRGRVGFDGAGVTNKIDPTLDFVATTSTSAVAASINIGGYASAPKITFTSVPDLPQDEVLAYLLFKRSSKDLGPLQLAEIAAAIAELTGVGSGANPLARIQKGLGLDRLSVGGGSTGTSPSVEAGRYVAPGVYVGAKQGATGGGTGATVQIDITRGLKVETDVGTGSGSNSLGLTYQFEY